jgi:hypothetical protein
MTRLLGDRRPVTLHPFEFGWLARPELSPEEQTQGRGLGQGSFIIDQEGVVTAHPSLSARILMRRYAAARREGRITGRQVWPEQDQQA